MLQKTVLFGKPRFAGAIPDPPMPNPILTQLTVLDLVPFGNTGTQSSFFALRLTPPPWEGWSPGQFVMLRPSGMKGEYVWGRPFSICHTSSRDLVIFFQVRGRATSDMARLVPGDPLDVWGPLGNSLAVEPDTPTLLLAGGIGIAPFVGYVQNHPHPPGIRLEFGHRMPVECYPYDDMAQKIDARAHQENSPEDRDAFLHLVDLRIQEYAREGLVLACGPTPFLRAVQNFASRYGARAQLCLETRMACGVGACLGCVVRAHLPKDDEGAIRALARGNGGNRAESEGRNVQTCSCGPNFWADCVSFS